MKTRHLLLVLIPALLLGGAVYAVNSPQAKNAVAQFVMPAPMAPGIPQTASLGATTASATINFTDVTAGTRILAGICFRISCSAACEYRTGASGSIGTAVATDNDLPAATPERICLPPNQDSIAFFNPGGSALTWKVARLATPTADLQ